ncbi:ATP-binding protein [Actinomadura sp. SCN-SB]|uniref:ATP-binding protein n=1 Tax=Actinomadura sp. SCN-SB TaxID=3373092 RepID=UPI003753AD9B
MSANGLGAEGRGPREERVALWDLPAETASAATARALTGAALREWRVPDQGDVDDIVLMVDELVTNAILHGSGRVRLRLRLLPDEARLTAEVGDDNPVTPAPPGRGPGVLDWAEDGRGLLLVGALASAFGSRPEGHGKTVWFSRTLRSVNGHDPATPAPTTATAAGSTSASTTGPQPLTP